MFIITDIYRIVRMIVLPFFKIDLKKYQINDAYQNKPTKNTSINSYTSSQKAVKNFADVSQALSVLTAVTSKPFLSFIPYFLSIIWKWKIKIKSDITIFYYKMHNEHFQYGQRVNTSAYGADSSLRPTPFRLDAPRPHPEPLNSSSNNAVIIQKIEALFPIL